MDRIQDEAPRVATMDVCLAGVFIGKGERIPEDLYEAWKRRLVRLGLDRSRQSESAR